MEVGSEYELNMSGLKKVDDNIFDYLNKYCAIYTNSGRNAAKLLNKILPKGKILLPSYICQSVIDVYEQDYTIAYYQIERDFSINLQDLENNIDNDVVIIYLMHYFGRLQNDKVLQKLSKLRERYHCIIIEDTTHSIFTCANTIGDFCVCSLRKWFPISDGGVLYSRDRLQDLCEIQLPQNMAYKKISAMILKYSQIHYNVPCNDIYRMIFRQDEERLEQEKEIFAISRMSKLLLDCFSVTKLIVDRKKNLKYLWDNLEGYGLEMFVDDELYYTPFTLPVYCDNRDVFREYLIENNVFCAVHWPVEDKLLKRNNILGEMVGRIISLPLDQRYDENHMRYMVDIIKRYKTAQ